MSQFVRIPHGCLITWRTWFLDSFSPFMEHKCSNSLQSVCFDLSKRKQRRVSTRNKRDCEMSPAAQYDELQFYVNLPTCSNGLFALRSVRNLLGPFARMHIWILKSDRSTLLFPTLINTFKGFFSSFGLSSTKNAFTKQRVSMKNRLCLCSCIYNDFFWIHPPVFAVIVMQLRWFCVYSQILTF